MAAFMKEFEKLIIPLEIIKSATNNFGDHNFIAEGGYGKVYRGEFLLDGGKTMGAVKRWSLSNEEGDPEFRREIMLLSDNRHENLISLIGFCYENKERVLVYEYAANKSLDFHLKDPKLTWIQRIKICLGAARGLEYLHNPRGAQRVLHCDIKSANILLDENWNAKIADFGLSKYGPVNQNRSYLITQAKGTFGYTDPAFLETMVYTKESDVYSFGVVLFEVLCSRLCLDSNYDAPNQFLVRLVKNSSNEEIRETLVDINLRQQMADNSFDTFLTLAHQCLEREQKQRPSMDSIVGKLETSLEYQEQRNIILSDVNLASSSEEEKRDILGQKEQDQINQSGENLDDVVNNWSSGKEGNLQALLSTLHEILGPESGWKQVSLTKTTNTTTVRRLYQKAISQIHPSMLKKRGASIEEKYICGKLLKILKVCFERFDSDERDRLRILGDKYDDVIRSWSNGKEGDLRTLLSTLHDILGAESGWESVSVTNTMSISDVRKLYQKADSLILRAMVENPRSSIKEKYIGGKVSEILKVGFVRMNAQERDQIRSLVDDDIKRWSKDGLLLLGDLLSTLQDILGHESGWEPVSLDGQWSTRYLSDAYTKSLHLTDPEKLKERRASMKEIYLYGEVRKILKDHWNFLLDAEK